MNTDVEWLDMEENCHNCGKPLEARPGTDRGPFIISGYEAMEWRHTDGTFQCVITHSPRPYSDAGQYKEYCRLRQERENANERLYDRYMEEPPFRGSESGAFVERELAETRKLK